MSDTNSANIISSVTSSNYTFESYKIEHQNLMSRAKSKIVSPSPIMTLSNFPLIYQNSITLIQGQKGSHKSRIVEAIISTFLKNTGLAGLESNINDVFIIHTDTERNVTYQFPNAIKRIFDCSELIIDDTNYFAMSLTTTERTQRLDDIKSVVKEFRDKYPQKHLIIVIDVTTDLIANFNDVGNSLELTDYLNTIINQFNCSVICVIHENPSSDSGKSRGHTGSELTNKSSSVIQCKASAGGSEVTVSILHSRYSASNTFKCTLAFDSDNQSLKLLQNSYLVPSFKDFIFSSLSNGDKSQLELINLYKSIEKISSKSFVKKIKEIVGIKYDSGTISEYLKDKVRYYKLVPKV